MGKTKKKIIITVTITALLGVLYGALMLFSAFYHQIYDTPKIENGVLDLHGSKIKESAVEVVMDGEWEFFYNKWIITDNIDTVSDGTINMPGRWTDLKIDGKRLPAAGYASYRIKVINDNAENALRIHLMSSHVAYRVFINGNLNTRYGELSKEVGKDVTKGALTESVRYKAIPNEELIVVVEIAATDYGGFLSAMWLGTSKPSDPAISFFVTYFPYIIVGIMLAFVGFSIITNLGSKQKSQYFSAILALSTLLHFLMTKDVLSKIAKFTSVNYAFIYRIFNPLTALLLIFSAVMYLIAEKTIKPDKFFYIASSVIVAIGTVMYIFLRGYSLSVLTLIMFLLLFVLIFWYVSAAITEKRQFAKVNMAAFFVLAGILLIEYFDNFGMIVFGTDGIFTVGLVLYMLVICVLSFIKARINARLAMNALRYEHEISVIKTHALRAQIKPHFVFNSLAAIQSVYHSGIDDGDAAMAKFSKHLRLNIDADNIDLIPFTEEVENILNYFELENLRVQNAFTLLLDIDYSDFDIPILSLQPLIENAVRYSGVDKKEDGYIRLKTEKKGDVLYLSVIDNGNGFDPNTVRPDAAGLKNLKERFKYLLNAEVSIDSKLGEGTIVTIIIRD